jgi:hypothetical protein
VRYVACLIAAFLLQACGLPASATRPPTSSIETVGIVTAVRIYQDRVEYRLADGRSWTAAPGTYRTVMDWGAKLLVVGSDPHGRWLATFGPQDGLPDDCYFTPEPGTDWGDGIAIAGVLWHKAAEFQPAGGVPGIGKDYAGGTRFCLDEDGLVASTIAP